MTRRNTVFHPVELTVGSVKLDTENQELISRNSIRLAKKEARLMEYLMQNPDKALSTDDIFLRVWNREGSQDIVWVYISYLRQKLLAIKADLEIIGERGDSFILRSIKTEKENDTKASI